MGKRDIDKVNADSVGRTVPIIGSSFVMPNGSDVDDFVASSFAVDLTDYMPHLKGRQKFVFPDGRKIEREALLGAESFSHFKGQAATAITSVPLKTLTDNFVDLVDRIHDMVTPVLAKSLGDLPLDSIDVNLEVTADGSVGFMGTGAKIGGTASIKLTFSRAAAAH